MARQGGRFIVTTVAMSLLAACSDPPIKAGNAEGDVVKVMGKPSVTFGKSTEFGGFFDDNKECRKKLVKVMLYDRRWRSDVIVGVNGEGVVECVDVANGAAVTNFHR